MDAQEETKQPEGNKKPEIRGLFGRHGDSSHWLETVSRFPNGVPRFNSKQEAIDFITDYTSKNGGSNPDIPHLEHVFTLLVGWEQIEKYLLPAIEKARREPSQSAEVPHDFDTFEGSENIYERPENKAVMEAIAERLDVPFHKSTNPVSTLNTLKYLYHHMKLEDDDDLDSYYAKKGRGCGEYIEPDMSKWWANGNIVNNELTQEKDQEKSQYWGDHFMTPHRDMLVEAARERKLPDCEFFLNKRDYPQLKDDRYPDQDVDLAEEHKFKTYAPIVSFRAASPNRFTDIPFPSSEDWEAASGVVFAHGFMRVRNMQTGKMQIRGSPRDLFTENNFRMFERPWEGGRVATAFFRGTATGGGTTPENNQRIKVASLCFKWKDDEEKGGKEPFLDAQLVGWNLRDKKTAESPMTFLRNENLPFTASRFQFTPIYEQSKYKYLVYVDGHCVACRYGFMMRLGSVILKVASRQVADRMWYFDLLKPYHDLVPVKADLSDLEEKIRWCREHDDECRQIGENAQAFYKKYVARDALLDYVEVVCKNVAKRFFDAPS